MNFELRLTSEFKKEFKRLYKKYPSLKSDLTILLKTLEHEPTEGVSLGKDCYKVRLAIKSKGRGKSGGAQVVTYIQFIGNTVFLLTIFDKSERANISDKELREILSQL